ncbi:hypothetical protein DFR86_01635 [Acidianus sulfidivorans JP7]|uniref:Uncharacterized protein n=1 Tax=Acidianus sulfidivorans JP7 TaxID=619593 RepID=A0A2U9IK76_9CREN|nr:hypothetical protein [Acidianus sulfidivorans]AWR96376.1 hypothetical protein DFR86_01635 [Acidianus sulfidivorans JP7]
MGFSLILISAVVIGLSFSILFLGFRINLGSFNVSSIIIKIINFIIILVFFVYIAYTGYVMMLSSKER